MSEPRIRTNNFWRIAPLRKADKNYFRDILGNNLNKQSNFKINYTTRAQANMQLCIVVYYSSVPPLLIVGLMARGLISQA